MFAPTHRLRITYATQTFTFFGFTAERFKTLYIDPAEALNARDKVFSYNHKMNQDLMDLRLPAVQNALRDSIRYAADAASAAAEYFAKRPTRFHSLSRMEKIFERHFKNTAPSDEQRQVVQETFERTAAGLRGNVGITDLFAGADLFGAKSALTWGAEGQVAFDAETDQRYIAEVLQEGGIERMNDIMREFLSTAENLDIYLNFSLIKTSNVFEMARIIVHEATHKYAFTGDYAYMSDARKFGLMAAADAVKNADSYAYAAISVKAESALTPEKIRRLGLPLVR
jgi:hypothetical protein